MKPWGMLRGVLTAITLGVGLSGCVKLDPSYSNSSGALLNNYSLYEDPIRIVYAANGNFGDWASLRLLPQESGWGHLQVTRMSVEPANSEQQLPITQCYEPVDGINILRCDVADNAEGVRSFTIRQAFDDEPTVEGLDIAVKRDQVVIQINPSSGKSAGNLVGEFAPFTP